VTSGLCVDYEFRAALLFSGSEPTPRGRQDSLPKIVQKSINSDVLEQCKLVCVASDDESKIGVLRLADAHALDKKCCTSSHATHTVVGNTHGMRPYRGQTACAPECNALP
jgi:hypothetical protein